MSRRKGTAYLLASLIAVVSALFLGAPAHAYGGGCYTPDVGYGWSVAVCSSDDGVNMYPDYYINRVGSGADSGYCVTRGGVEDANGNPYLVWSEHPCRRGHYTVPSVYLRNKSVGLRTHVEIWVKDYNGPQHYRLISAFGPFTYCC